MGTLVQLTGLRPATSEEIIEVVDAVRRADRFAKGLQADLNCRYGVEEEPAEGLHPAAIQFVSSICDLDILEYLRLQSLVQLFDFMAEAQANGHDFPDWLLVHENHLPPPRR